MKYHTKVSGGYEIFMHVQKCNPAPGVYDLCPLPNRWITKLVVSGCKWIWQSGHPSMTMTSSRLPWGSRNQDIFRRGARKRLTSYRTSENENMKGCLTLPFTSNATTLNTQHSHPSSIRIRSVDGYLFSYSIISFSPYRPIAVRPKKCPDFYSIFFNL